MFTLQTLQQHCDAAQASVCDKILIEGGRRQKVLHTMKLGTTGAWQLVVDYFLCLYYCTCIKCFNKLCKYKHATFTSHVHTLYYAIVKALLQVLHGETDKI